MKSKIIIILIINLILCSCGSKKEKKTYKINKQEKAYFSEKFLFVGKKCMFEWNEDKHRVIINDSIENFNNIYWNNRNAIAKLITDESTTEFMDCNSSKKLMVGDIVFYMMDKKERFPLYDMFNVSFDVIDLSCGDLIYGLPYFISQDRKLVRNKVLALKIN